MKIGIYDPYLDTLGGGEKYISQIAKCLSSQEVTIFWDDTEILSKIEKRFGISLNQVAIAKNIFSPTVPIHSRLIQSKKYDAIFFISDGSFPLLLTRKVYPIIQFPIAIGNNKIKNRIKFHNIRGMICYSEFVKENLNKNSSPIIVVNPAVEMIGSGEKQNVILSVGRFTQGNNEKNQEMLIDFFQDHKNVFKDWKLIIVGGVLPEDEEFVERLRNKIKDDSIELLTNISRLDLEKFYKKSKIYWHAAGFGKDISINPSAAEHFGITVVEAMSAGAVPVVFKGGGLSEIVSDGKDGYLWRTEEELLQNTKLAMNTRILKELSENAVKRAHDFGEEKFCKKINELVEMK